MLVKSRGIELGGAYNYSKDKFSAGCSSEFYYTISTNEKTLLENDASLHCQLIYVPRIRVNARIFAQYKSTGIHVMHNYTGYRFTSSDNTEYLPPYSNTNVEADQTIPFSKMQLRLYVRISNLFNSDYQSVKNRPMALRTFGGGITLSYK